MTQSPSSLRILVNFAPLKQGGGQTVALNFLQSIDRAMPEDLSIHYLVARGSQLNRFLAQHPAMDYSVAPTNPVARILFEVLFGGRLLTRYCIDGVYTYFGYAWFPPKWPQISGSADSNLYFPEINFWSDYSAARRVLKAVIDRYRLAGVKRATAVIFENAALEERGRQLYGLQRTVTIRPSICVADRPKPFTFPVQLRPDCKRALFLCGWHANKNVMLIPKLASEFRKRHQPILFVLTAPPDGSSFHRKFLSLVASYDVSDQVVLTGPVLKEQLPSLYAQIDYVFLLSKLESFSNTILESWHFKRPLFVSDEAWARSICGEAAVYVPRDSAEAIAEKVCDFIQSSACADALVRKGQVALSGYPSCCERIRRELLYVCQIIQSI